MHTQTIELFAVMHNTDKVEGRGASMPTGIYFPEKYMAEDFVASTRYRKWAVMGIVGPDRNGHNVKEVKVKIFSDIADYDHYYDKEARSARRAELVAAMSPEDQKLFGPHGSGY